MRCFCKFYNFLCLFLDWLNSWNNENNHVGDFCSSCSHVLKSFVTRRVNKSHFINTTIYLPILTFRHLDCECANGLSNCSEFFFAFVKVCSKRVQQSSLPVINMTHNCYDRGSLFVLMLVLCNQLDFKFQLETHKFDCFVRKNLKLICTNVVWNFLNKF
jgi:hypothetical protein